MRFYKLRPWNHYPVPDSIPPDFNESDCDQFAVQRNDENEIGMLLHTWKNADNEADHSIVLVQSQVRVFPHVPADRLGKLMWWM